jgi:hypothetical protein
MTTDSNIVEVNALKNWSLTQLANEFGHSRETIQKRLNAANVKPTGTKRGYAVYGIGNAARAILLGGAAGETDPEKMTPSDRLMYYKGTNERRKSEIDEGNLIEVEDARTQMAYIAKSGIQVLETLPDILERDFMLDFEVIEKIEALINNLRDQWAEHLSL